MKKLSRASVLFLVIFSMFLPVTISADELRGRLPDGRAYRTDSDGTQLVDYIAELELSIEALNRRVHGLEYELEERDKRIGRLQRSGAREAAVQERDLFPRQDQAFSLGEASLDQDPRFKAELEERIRPVQEALAEKTAETKRLLDELELTRMANDRLMSEQHARADSGQDAQGQAVINAKRESWQKEREALEQQIARLTTDAQTREQKHAQELARLEQDRNRAANQIASKEQELKDYQARLRSTEVQRGAGQEIAEQRVAHQAERPASQPGVQRAPQQAPARVASRAEQENLLASRNRAVDSLKARLSEELTSLGRQIANRDRLYQQYTSAERTVSFRPSRAVSSNNRSIQTIRSEMARATSVHHLTPLSRDITEIQSKIQEDVDFINRMMKMN